MKFFCIGGEDAVRGFRLAGVEGRTASSAGTVAAALDEAAGRPDCAVVILTRQAAELARRKVEEMREREKPLIVELGEGTWNW